MATDSFSSSLKFGPNGLGDRAAHERNGMKLDAKRKAEIKRVDNRSSDIWNGNSLPVPQQRVTQTQQQSYGWGADLRDYKMKQMLWPQHKVKGAKWKRDKKITNYDMKRKNRSFDPVLQRFIEQDRESQFQAQEASNSQISMEKAKSRFEKTSYVPYNIVSTELWPGRKDLPQKHAHRVPDSSIPFNIVNFEPKEGSLYIDRGPEKGKGMRFLLPISGKKDYNLVSNHYYKNNTFRAKSDKEKNAADLFNRLERTRDFNPVNSEYYNQEKEKDFITMRDKLQKTNGLMQLEFRPESIKHAEGNLYNIINQDPNKSKAAQGRLSKWEAKQARKFDSEARGNFEAKAKQRQEDAYQLKVTRMMNSQSETRAFENVRKGFDSFKGVDAKTIYLPKKEPKRSLWDRTSIARDCLKTTDMNKPRQDGMIWNKSIDLNGTKNVLRNGGIYKNISATSAGNSIVNNSVQVNTNTSGQSSRLSSRPDVPALCAPGQLLETVQPNM